MIGDVQYANEVAGSVDPSGLRIREHRAVLLQEVEQVRHLLQIGGHVRVVPREVDVVEDEVDDVLDAVSEVTRRGPVCVLRAARTGYLHGDKHDDGGYCPDERCKSECSLHISPSVAVESGRRSGTSLPVTCHGMGVAVVTRTKRSCEPRAPEPYRPRGRAAPNNRPASAFTKPMCSYIASSVGSLARRAFSAPTASRRWSSRSSARSSR